MVKIQKSLILLIICSAFYGCSPQAYSAFSDALASAYGSNSSKLMIYGGANNQVYLGCITCSEYDSESIFNEYGTYGSEYSTNSIWNSYGSYGSNYGSYSPWNPNASNPPVIVDPSGNFYGYFTVNKYHPDRTQIRKIVNLLNSY